ncbi:MAG: DNA replication/repair protein RecF [Sphingomonadales bacterium]
MLRIQKIALLQFKNYSRFEANFEQRVVGICGANGVGKTSLLDAIHYLGLTKSYFSRHDQLVVQSGQEGFRIEGSVELNGLSSAVACVVREAGKKEFYLNGAPYEKLSTHIGKFPVVVIAPDDVLLVTGDSKERRSFIDQLLAQVNPVYLQSLIRYNRVLLQRNALLKQSDFFANSELSLLDVLDEQLSKEGQTIYETRAEFLGSFIKLVEENYRSIAATTSNGATTPPVTESVSIEYQSQLKDRPLSELLRQSRPADQAAQRTTRGIHRDELQFTLLQQPFRQMASQGQRKSLLFALKLAQVQVIKEIKGFSPLLLLDDVFEKLDEKRIQNLLQKVCSDTDGQLFITDTSAERLGLQLSALGVPFQLVSL